MVAGSVTSEVGRSRTVLLHRPGPELRRLPPRHATDLLRERLPAAGAAR